MLEPPVVAQDLSPPGRPGPRFTLDGHQLRELEIGHLPGAGTEVLVQGIARVVHSSSADHDADGSVDAVTLVLEFDMNETHVEPIPEEPKPARSRAEIAESLYEPPRRRLPVAKVGERSVGGSPWSGEFGDKNRRYGA